MDPGSPPPASHLGLTGPTNKEPSGTSRGPIPCSKSSSWKPPRAPRRCRAAPAAHPLAARRTVKSARCFDFLRIPQPTGPPGPDATGPPTRPVRDTRVSTIFTEPFQSLSHPQRHAGRLLCAYIPWTSTEMCSRLSLCPLCGFPLMYMSDPARLRHMSPCTSLYRRKFGPPSNTHLLAPLLQEYWDRRRPVPSFLNDWAPWFFSASQHRGASSASSASRNIETSDRHVIEATLRPITKDLEALSDFEYEAHTELAALKVQHGHKAAEPFLSRRSESVACPAAPAPPARGQSLRAQLAAKEAKLAAAEEAKHALDTRQRQSRKRQLRTTTMMSDDEFSDDMRDSTTSRPPILRNGLSTTT